MLCSELPVGFSKFVLQGEVMVEIPHHKYGIILSSNEGAFESIFVEKQPGLKAVLVNEKDASILDCKRVRKSIGGICNRNVTDLHDLLDSHENMFLKLDIKGYEFERLRSLKSNQLFDVDQLLIAMYPASTDHSETIKKISQTHNLVHCIVCGDRKFQCTYLHKKFF